MGKPLYKHLHVYYIHDYFYGTTQWSTSYYICTLLSVQNKLSQNENKKSVYALKMEKISSADKSMKSVDSLIYHGLMP